MPPEPPPVTMCEGEKLVTVMSARAAVGVPRKVAPSASQESSMTVSPWRSATPRMTSQSGALPARFGIRIARVCGSDLGLERLRVDVEGVRLDVDEDRHQPGAHERGDVGRERQR